MCHNPTFCYELRELNINLDAISCKKLLGIIFKGEQKKANSALL